MRKQEICEWYKARVNWLKRRSATRETLSETPTAHSRVSLPSTAHSDITWVFGHFPAMHGHAKPFLQFLDLCYTGPSLHNSSLFSRTSWALHDMNQRVGNCINTGGKGQDWLLMHLKKETAVVTY